jgi:predicted CoA-binding protein
MNNDVNNVTENVSVNNPEQALLSQEVLPVNVDHVDVNAEAMDVNNLEQVLLENVDHVDVSRKDDIDIDIVKELIKKRVKMRRKPRK